MAKKRNLDTIYFSVMRDGRRQDVCWTDLIWEDRIEFMRKHNNEAWLIRMIQLMNMLAWQMNDACPGAKIQIVALPQGKQVSLTWLRNSLVRITADIRLVAEEYGIERERE
jgi:hypothetical protein